MIPAIKILFSIRAFMQSFYLTGLPFPIGLMEFTTGYQDSRQDFGGFQFCPRAGFFVIPLFGRFGIPIWTAPAEQGTGVPRGDGALAPTLKMDDGLPIQMISDVIVIKLSS